jgi:hypothetical protein
MWHFNCSDSSRSGNANGIYWFLYAKFTTRSLRQTMRHDPDDKSKITHDTRDDNVATENDSPAIPNREAMTLIPWKDIWSLLKVAKHRGNDEMVEVFYDTLFKEAVFDDNGAWAWDLNKRH